MFENNHFLQFRFVLLVITSPLKDNLFFIIKTIKAFKSTQRSYTLEA